VVEAVPPPNSGAVRFTAIRHRHAAPQSARTPTRSRPATRASDSSAVRNTSVSFPGKTRVVATDRGTVWYHARLGNSASVEETVNVSVNEAMVTTAFELPGYRVTKNLGLVRGITVRSRSILGTLGASLQTVVGGNITLFETMCEETREQALDLMMEHAAERGANAVLGVRYDATEIMQGVTEVIAYGTAVLAERAT
jgi:uncharacterized protein YbjQ (UPF0145 family)